jgi:isocitrate dehydrogenase
MPQNTPITIAYGDGIGPEIMEATLRILEAAGARIDPEPIEIGEKVYRRGNTAGIEPNAWESLRRTRVFLKAPITTPQGGGFKSLNVTTRKMLGLYANVRPCVSYYPFVRTRHPGMDVVVVRENEEDLYAGIEHRQTDDVTQCLKLISRPGCERIVRYAFEYAVQHKRTKVTCFTKDNIMKLTDGLFHRVFDEIAADYPAIENEHWIVDIGAAKLADTPGAFDVVVMPNLYGDILSDVAAQIAGSVGLAGSANIGEQCAMFEAIHGSAPRRAGQNLANPSGLLLGAVMMLVHIGQPDVAARVHNAWLRTIEDGVHTYDIYNERVSTQKVGTKQFADAVIARLGQTPKTLKSVDYEAAQERRVSRRPAASARPPVRKDLVGVDLFLDWLDGTADQLAEALQRLGGDLELTLISDRGVKVWPDGFPETYLTGHWRCRFMAPRPGAPPPALARVSPAQSGANQRAAHEAAVSHGQIIDLLQRVAAAGFDFIKTDNLYNFDGEAGYSLSQGE